MGDPPGVLFSSSLVSHPFDTNLFSSLNTLSILGKSNFSPCGRRNSVG
jgi:hypothetical protein